MVAAWREGNASLPSWLVSTHSSLETGSCCTCAICCSASTGSRQLHRPKVSTTASKLRPGCTNRCLFVSVTASVLLGVRHLTSLVELALLDAASAGAAAGAPARLPWPGLRGGHQLPTLFALSLPDGCLGACMRSTGDEQAFTTAALMAALTISRRGRLLHNARLIVACPTSVLTGRSN